MLYKTISATDFIRSSNYFDLLASANKIVLDDEKLANSELTTDEVKFCLEDIKVCGVRELRQILQWRRNILKEISEEEALEGGEATGKSAAPAALKKRKRKLLKEKADMEKRKKLKMVLEGDVFEIPGEQELFSLKKVAQARNQANARLKKRPEREDTASDSKDDDDNE
ncbi:unnamed protein product [Gongylonema pulchrum]|uniref:DUF3381 domain-containing protein n=1 Tax=Gongylonema pulchrum TaxID=637853 RepID=A0A3P7NN69_9BILA|nr:unnamed protein product [Gongylonema pulchrum]